MSRSSKSSAHAPLSHQMSLTKHGCKVKTSLDFKTALHETLIKKGEY